VTNEVRSFRPSDADGIREVLSASLARDGIPGFTAADITRQLERMVPDP
jgi:hypothetical protein